LSFCGNWYAKLPSFIAPISITMLLVARSQSISKSLSDNPLFLSSSRRATTLLPNLLAYIFGVSELYLIIWFVDSSQLLKSTCGSFNWRSAIKSNICFDVSRASLRNSWSDMLSMLLGSACPPKKRYKKKNVSIGQAISIALLYQASSGNDATASKNLFIISMVSSAYGIFY
jgi:hypothetical protein